MEIISVDSDARLNPEVRDYLNEIFKKITEKYVVILVNLEFIF